MALIVGHNGPSAYANTIANRTGQSGGSVGGVKKAGIFGGSVGWPQGNMGRAVFWRAPQTTPNLLQLSLLTTRNPVQYRRGSYAASHNGLM
jgi:hypothetical protein